MYYRIYNMINSIRDMIRQILIEADHVLLIIAILALIVLIYAIFWESKRYKKKL